MREIHYPDSRIDKDSLDTLLDRETEELSQYIVGIIEDDEFGISPVTDISNKGLDRLEAKLLSSDLNRPSIFCDKVSESLITSLSNLGIMVSSFEGMKHWGAYSGGSIVYKRELNGVLKAQTIAHEAAHHFAGHSYKNALNDDEEAIAESAAMLSLRAFNIDPGAISLPYIKRYIASTGNTNGFVLWKSFQKDLPVGLKRAKVAAGQIVSAVEEGKLA